MNEMCVANSSGMLLTQQYRITLRTIYLTATIWSRNLTYTVLGSKTRLLVYGPAISHISCGFEL